MESLLRNIFTIEVANSHALFWRNDKFVVTFLGICYGCFLLDILKSDEKVNVGVQIIISRENRIL